MASLLAACSQEELVPNVAGSAVNDSRPIVGNVVFGETNAETRYNYANGAMDADEKMGVYLMDEFRGWKDGCYIGELNNANKTEFTWQQNWWQMYNMVNYVQSNFTYLRQANGTFKNESAQLVEGNYLSIVPLNEKITNRRDLWYPINPVVELTAHDTKDNYYVGRNNQFFLGYNQLYREGANGNAALTVDPQLKGILTYAKFNIENVAANQFVVEKLVFTTAGGDALPTVAYVKPAEAPYSESCITYPSWLAEQISKADPTEKDVCNNVVGTLWDKTWWDQSVARDLVKYETTKSRIPYGLTGEASEVAYEYVFTFPNDVEGGVLLGGNNADDAADRVLTVSLALPPFYTVDGEELSWNDMLIEVHGKMYDPNMPILKEENGKWIENGKGGWRPGIVKYIDGSEGEVNAQFKLNDVKEFWTNNGMAIPETHVSLDDRYFAQEEFIRVSNTADLLNLMAARLTEPTTTGNIAFEVVAYGNGLEITQDVVDAMDTYEKQHDVTVTMNFDGTSEHGDAPIILADANIIERFAYENVDVILNADQTVSKKDIKGIATLTNNAKLTIKDKKLSPEYLINSEDKTTEKIIIETIGNVTIETKALHNYGKVIFGGTMAVKDININANGNVENSDATIHNFNVMNINGTLSVSDNIVNANDCLTCHDNVAVLNNNGTLNVKDLNNGYGDLGGVLNNNAGAELNVTGTLTNAKNAAVNNSGDGEIHTLTNNGTFTMNAGTVNVNWAFSGNEPVINGGKFNKNIYNVVSNKTHTYNITLKVINSDIEDEYADLSSEIGNVRLDEWDTEIKQDLELTAGNITALWTAVNKLRNLAKTGNALKTLKVDGSIVEAGAAEIVLNFDETLLITLEEGAEAPRWIKMTEAYANDLKKMVGTEVESLKLDGVGLDLITPEMELSFDKLTVVNTFRSPFSIQGVEGNSGKLITVDHFDYSGVGEVEKNGQKVLGFCISHGYVYVDQTVGEGAADHVTYVNRNISWFDGNGFLEATTATDGKRVFWKSEDRMWHDNSEKHK